MADKNTISSFTALGTLLAGAGLGAVSAGLIGSIYLRGDVITPGSVNPAPSLVYDSGAYLTFSQSQFAASGGLIGDKVATISVPSTFASGAVLHRVSIECANGPAGGTVDVGIVASSDATGSGQRVLNNVSVGTGALTEFVSSGATLNLTKVIPSNHILKVGSLTAMTAGNQCVVKA